MKKYARIEEGLVVELLATDGDITQMFHPDLVWMDCSHIPDIETGWTFKNDKFIAYSPVVPTQDELKQIKIAEITAAFQDEIDAGFTATSGIRMDSTMADLQTLKLAYDFAVLMNETTMAVVDFDNVAHVAVPLPDVLTLIMEIGAHYRDVFFRKQYLRGQATAAQNSSELDLIFWS